MTNQHNISAGVSVGHRFGSPKRICECQRHSTSVTEGLRSEAELPSESDRKRNQCRQVLHIHSRVLTRYAALVSLFLFALTCRAAEADSLKVAADSLYAADDYKGAAQLYSQLEPTATVCYNLGNCFYRSDDMARAVLWYERAAMLDPSDGDIRFNLDMARSKTIDNVTPKHEIFFVGWYRSLVNIASVDTWGYMSIAAFALALVFLALCIFLGNITLRKTSLTLCVLFLLVTVMGNVCAFSQRYRLLHRTGAIVMDASAVVKSTPSASGNDLFVLHEGTKVEIRDNTLSDWYEIELADGKVGWIESKQLEII